MPFRGGLPFLPLAAIDQGHLLSIVVLAVAVAMMHLERPLARAQTTLALRGRELTDAGRVVPPAMAGDVACVLHSPLSFQMATVTKCDCRLM